jgi:hypothetical protein
MVLQKYYEATKTKGEVSEKTDFRWRETVSRLFKRFHLISLSPDVTPDLAWLIP